MMKLRNPTKYFTKTILDTYLGQKIPLKPFCVLTNCPFCM